MAYNLKDYHGPSGLPLDWKTIDISSNDHVDENGFAAIATATGVITYRTLLGEADQQISVENGDWIFPTKAFPGGALQAVRTNSAIPNIIVVKFTR